METTCLHIGVHEGSVECGICLLYSQGAHRLKLLEIVSDRRCGGVVLSGNGGIQLLLQLREAIALQATSFESLRPQVPSPASWLAAQFRQPRYTRASWDKSVLHIPGDC